MKQSLKIFDRPENIKKFLIGFYASLVLLIIVDPVVHLFVHKHADFSWEGFPGFFAAYGFISCVLLIFIAKGLRLLLKRDERYYD